MLETTRLFLRPMDEADVDSVFAMRSDADVMRFIRAPQIEIGEAENWVKLISSRWATERIGFCALIEKQTGQFIGWCGLWRLTESKEIEVGYALRKEFWGRGFAVEASEAFLHYGFDDLNLEKIVAVADPENRNSRRVMEKLGMFYDGTGKYYARELAHYTITKTVWTTRRRGDAAKTSSIGF